VHNTFGEAKATKNERNTKEKTLFSFYFRVHCTFGEAKVTKKRVKYKRKNAFFFLFPSA
jgi:hypothetical protein